MRAEFANRIGWMIRPQIKKVRGRYRAGLADWLVGAELLDNRGDKRLISPRRPVPVSPIIVAKLRGDIHKEISDLASGGIDLVLLKGALKPRANFPRYASPAFAQPLQRCAIESNAGVDARVRALSPGQNRLLTVCH
jgi:hypothetical protein